MVQHRSQWRNLGIHGFLNLHDLFRITSVRGDQMDKNEDLILDQLARAIGLQTLQDFYSDPANLQEFEEWKKEKANP